MSNVDYIIESYDETHVAEPWFGPCWSVDV